MEMFFLNYVNKLCVYPRLFLQVGLLKTQNRLDKLVCFTHANVLSYVNETMYLLGNLPFFIIHVNHFTAWDDLLTLCQCYLKMHVVGEGPGATL